MAEVISDEAILSQFYDNLQVFFGIEDVEYGPFFRGLFKNTQALIQKFFLACIDDPIVQSRIYDIPDIYIVETIMRSIEGDDIVLEVLNDIVQDRNSILGKLLSDVFIYRDGQFQIRWRNFLNHTINE